MNFLSHYFVSSVPNDPIYNSGLILPDLLRKEIRVFNTPNNKYAEAINSLLKASHQHQNDDKHFHASYLFHQISNEVLNEIKKDADVKHLPRKWFVAHIASEMLLDRILMRHYPNLLKQFYSDLDQLDSNLYEAFILTHQTTVEPKVLNRFEQFKRSRYLVNYTCNQLFSFSIWRIMTNVGIPNVNRQDVHNLVELLQGMEESFFLDRYSLIFDLKQICK